MLCVLHCEERSCSSCSSAWKRKSSCCDGVLMTKSRVDGDEGGGARPHRITFINAQGVVFPHAGGILRTESRGGL